MKLTDAEHREALLGHWYCGLTHPDDAAPAAGWPPSSYVTGQFIKAVERR